MVQIFGNESALAVKGDDHNGQVRLRQTSVPSRVSVEIAPAVDGVEVFMVKFLATLYY